MNAANPVRGSRKTSGRRLHESSEQPGRNATWVMVDAELEVRERLVAIADELDGGDVGTALLNARLLLADLDEAGA